jgi:hypothetical protein
MPESKRKLEGELIRGWVRTALRDGQPSRGRRGRTGRQCRRRVPRARWPMRTLIQADDEGNRLYVHAVGRDVSLSGIGVVMQREIGKDARVRLWIRGGRRGVSGRVTHSTPLRHGRVVGIAFDAAPPAVTEDGQGVGGQRVSVSGKTSTSTRKACSPP